MEGPRLKSGSSNALLGSGPSVVPPALLYEFNDVLIAELEVKTLHVERGPSARFGRQHEHLTVPPTNADCSFAPSTVEKGGKLLACLAIRVLLHGSISRRGIPICLAA